MFRPRIAPAIAAIAATLLAACGGGSDAGGDDGTITFWYAMAGRNGEAIQAMVDTFNQQHEGEIRVEAVYQGNYYDTLNKLKAAIQSGQTPNLVQVFEIGTQLMIDLQSSVPFGEMAEEAGYSLDDLQPRLVDYYTVDGTLYSLPFNASAPMLYYNKTAFEEVGLDPEQPPQTLEEVAEAAERLTIRRGGQTERYGYVAAIDGWLIEQMMANTDLPYCDQGNGREGRPTAVNWTNPTVENMLGWWRDLVERGIALNVGRNNNDASAAFQSGRAAILPFTAANMRDIITGSDFEVGVAYYPKAEPGTGGGVFNGGGSIWTMAGHPESEQEAAFEFLKYVASPEAQATWAAATGYIPVSLAARDHPVFQDVLAEYPDFAKPGEQLLESEITVASRGCLMGTMPEARDQMNTAIERVLLGNATPADALAAATESMGRVIETYNQSVS